MSRAIRRTPAAKVGITVAVIALLIFALFPAYWMVSTALDGKAASRGSQLLPQSLTLKNFSTVINDGGFGHYLRNSLLVAVITVVLSAMVALLASVAVARFRFRFRTSVVVMILIVQMVPLEALVIPLFLQMRQYHALNSLLALSVVYLAFSLPFGIWMMRGFVAAVPKEIEEAAYVDGAGWWRMFFSVLLPLVAPGLVATSVFSFITAWNEFIFALTFMSDDSKYTATVGLQKFFGQNTAEWGPIMAASTLLSLPVVIFFTVVQRRLAQGLTSGAVKG
ncbi:carbohydrate ABC transporter permease [Nakamurella lactea]|uniref:carbohydrate ABC transporter permease n=1 Tax=Nakamurella lactea TaxID=459515 RepID=UPI000429BB9D|nr:carbohydrate ABC transporter permease [Nakamurella lactea]